MTQTQQPSERRRPGVWILLGAALVLGGGIGAFLAFSRSVPDPIVGAAVSSTTTSMQTSSSMVPTSTTVPATTSTTAPAPAEEFEIVVPVAADTTLVSDEAAISFGEEEEVEAVAGETDTSRGLLLFDIRGIPADRLVKRAVLELTQIDQTDGGGLLSLAGADWEEDQVTWATAPAVGAAVAPLPTSYDGTDVAIDVSSVVAGDGQLGFYVLTDSDDDVGFASRESGQGAVIVITVAAAGASPEEAQAGAVLVGAGDIASCESEGDEATASLIDAVIGTSDEVVVFALGDNAYEDGSAAAFSECYGPSWGRHKDITRPVPGAREYRSGSASAYFDYFGQAAGTPGEGWYSYDFARWHVIALNSNCEYVGCDLGSPQVEWLIEDLAGAPLCTLAYFHDPVFSSSQGGGNAELLPIFEILYDADVDLVVNADDHFYERFSPVDPDGEFDEQGIRQFVVGSGGRSLAQFAEPVPLSAVRYNEAFGVLAITLFADGYLWDFIPEAGTLFHDQGSGSCR